MSKPSYGSEKKHIIELYKQGLSSAEIARQTGYNRSYVWRTIKKYEEKGEPTPEEKPTPTPTEAKKPEVVITAEPVVIPPELKEKIAVEVKKGFLTEEEITSIFQSINDILPKKYQRPKESMKLLGKVWEKPLNRLVEKYLDENVDLYVAIIVTVIVFSPSVKDYIADKRKEAEEAKKKKRREKLEST